jgi:hypothetical protein
LYGQLLQLFTQYQARQCSVCYFRKKSIAITVNY